MGALASENSAMAREFLFFVERERSKGGTNTVFKNPSAAVMKHCQSCFNTVIGNLVLLKKLKR